MGKHKDHRSRSRSRSQKKKKHHKSKSKSREKKDDKHRDRDDQGALGRRRQSKFSDTPAPQPAQPQPQDNHLFDSGLIRIAQGGNALSVDAINIQAAADGTLKMSQKELFDTRLRMGGLANQGGRASNFSDGMQGPRVVVPTSTSWGDGVFQQMNPHIAAALNDPAKIKRKIFIPTDRNFNYAGVIIGPKGSNQKRLEEETGCKILVRGRGSQKDPSQPDAPDESDNLHVLVVGDTEMQVAKAVEEIEKVILAPPEVLNEIRQAQLKMVAKLKNDAGDFGNEDAFKVAVPSDCIGLVIGKGGETIKMLQNESGAKRVQVAPDKGESIRYLYIEGDEEACMKVKGMIDRIVESHQRVRIARTGLLPNDQPAARVELPVPDAFVGMVIGKQGANIKEIMARTGAIINVPPQTESKADRLVTITGYPEAVDKAKIEIETIVETGRRNQMIKLWTPIIMQQMMAMNMAAMGYDLYTPNPTGGPSVDPVMMNAMYQSMMENMQTIDSNMASLMQSGMGHQQQQMDPSQMQMMMAWMQQQQGAGMPQQPQQ